ncbi:bifunctional 4-hydroxy-2-oxoglutarate aldolase/2-dehydro-3-deoxy-phosphogluconate aldolase [Fusibacillus kribbianus]|uniref:2-dehydro-3-deoxy-phosphogluconate aldolase n=1 Tax=Fusibacillus kribbianus TaxID=3044208 RepID=A0AAP4BAK3_9FIRM|nr:bifunctional 4-hydroxy-2-oxoglutarate aldolase/2-dehydro-3-deoxy-phosphogluconate aldolase [Ruminococcus sp. YH-rum2234]MDI9241733.1 bifunctional 4-hydroxy-2-oxoglutarate aldolase/2-dehydro-3-deoxy-phosphogluconate aldolase [Ruminococcus sp. YH-rum2234]
MGVNGAEQWEVRERIKDLRVVPVVKLDRAEDALPLAKSLCAGGLPVAEVTFRTEAAEESIRRISASCPELLVGAGTVINTEQARRAVAAGARFLVSPGISEEIIRYAVKEGIPIFPGTCTPTEIMTAVSYGLDVVKFFPAAQYGGLKTIQALSGPFPQVRFMPTGGISAANLREYLDYPKIFACGGSWMVKDALIKEGKFDQIEMLTREAAAIAKGE